MMTITELCEKHREDLLPKWVERFFATYPLDSVGFLRSSGDPFSNPVGRITHEATALLYDSIAGKDANPERVKAALGELVRVRAVQDFNPSRALGPLYLLKSLIREKALAQNLCRELLELESRVDALALLAFDLYAEDREKVFTIRVEEVKRGQSQLVRWAKAKGVEGAK